MDNKLNEMCMFLEAPASNLENPTEKDVRVKADDKKIADRKKDTDEVDPIKEKGANLKKHPLKKDGETPPDPDDPVDMEDPPDHPDDFEDDNPDAEEDGDSTDVDPDNPDAKDGDDSTDDENPDDVEEEPVGPSDGAKKYRMFNQFEDLYKSSVELRETLNAMDTTNFSSKEKSTYSKLVKILEENIDKLDYILKVSFETIEYNKLLHTYVYIQTSVVTVTEIVTTLI
jgi:hypothetical protein